MTRKLLILLFATVLPFSLFAIRPGDAAPELEVLKWIKGDQIAMTFAAKNKNIVVIEFWATWAPLCKETMPMLTDLQKKYSDKGVVVISISTEDEKTVSGFINDRKYIGHRIAIDDTKKTYKKYMEADPGIPAVFVIGKGGEMLWKGHPMELDAVLEKVVNGKFDIKVQKKISLLHDDLKRAMEKDNQGLVSQIADDVLELDPSDDIALRCKLYYFERRNLPGEALAFLNKLQKKIPGHFPFYSVELGILDKTDASADEKMKVYEKALLVFKDDPDNLTSLSWMISDNMSFGTGSVKFSLVAALRAKEILPVDASGRRKGLCLNALARAYYNAGCIEQAIKVQQEAVGSFSGYDEEEGSKTLLKYYQEALDIWKKLIPDGSNSGKK
ncbi:MAG TPA: hypothetical protein DCZ94_04785 [Lentisphaeria bacterium]|nr:MAG: hypothetical protein A2X48_19990 [Lentisphaerae bacterium GWF2_49_21]HBC86252.1 hypothetical protein [Lentisphaeria bacterium]